MALAHAKMALSIDTTMLAVDITPLTIVKRVSTKVCKSNEVALSEHTGAILVHVLYIYSAKP